MKCLVVLLLLSSLSVRAAIINAASTSRADVSNAWFSASNGDTIVIPAGTSSWAEQQWFTNKAVRLTGAGVGNTVIRDTFTSYPWITIWLQPGLTTTIDNIEFEHVGATAAGQDRIAIFGMNNDNSFINIYHCRFEDFSSLFGPVVFGTDTAIGVIHHNQFVGGGLLTHVKASYYDGTFGARDYGNGSMFAPDYFGTTNFIFFEDNLVTNINGVSGRGSTDAQAGGRYVYRWNTNYNFNVQTHGSEAAERSGRAFEVYNNTFHGDGSSANAAYMRGGVTLIYSNTYDNWPAGSTFNLLDNRIREHLFAPFNGASGINPWDTNSTGIYTNGTVSNTGTLDNTITDFTKSFTTDIYKHHQLLRTSGKTVTTLTRSASLATATVTAHGFTNNDVVSIWGANDYGWNGVFTITWLSFDTFTFLASYPFETPATGTILCAKGQSFGRILSNTSTNIVFADSIYGAASSLRMTNGETYEIRKVIIAMDQVGVYGGTNFGTQAYPDVFNNLANFQTVSMCYQWDNVFLDTVIPWSTGFGGGGEFAHIIPGRHFTNNLAKPAYTGYTYPHPRAFILSSPTAPSTATGSTVQQLNGIQLEVR